MKPFLRILLSLPLLLAACAAPRAASSTPNAEGQADDRVYEMTELDVQPRLTNSAEFTRVLARGFPEVLRAAGVRGSVVVSFIVQPNGLPRAVRVIRASHQEFVQPTQDAVQRMRFRPGMIGGRAVSVRIEQPLDWEVGGSP